MVAYNRFVFLLTYNIHNKWARCLITSLVNSLTHDFCLTNFKLGSTLCITRDSGSQLGVIVNYWSSPKHHGSRLVKISSNSFVGWADKYRNFAICEKLIFNMFKQWAGKRWYDINLWKGNHFPAETEVESISLSRKIGVGRKRIKRWCHWVIANLIYFVFNKVAEIQKLSTLPGEGLHASLIICIWMGGGGHTILVIQ